VRRRFGHRCPPVLRPTRSPLHRHAPWRPLPARRRAFGPGSTRPWIPFRPRGFAPPRRFSPPSAPKRMDLAVRESRACCIPLPIVGFIAFRGSSCCCQPDGPLLATVAPLEGFPSRTAGPCLHGLLPSCRWPRRVARTSRVRVAATPLLRASRVEARLQGFALWRVRTQTRRFRRNLGLPSLGLLCPLQDPYARATWADAPVTRWTAGPLPRRRFRPDDPRSHGCRRRASLQRAREGCWEVASLRCPPRRRDPARS